MFYLLVHKTCDKPILVGSKYKFLMLLAPFIIFLGALIALISRQTGLFVFIATIYYCYENQMFKSLRSRSVEKSKINHSGRSYIGETMQLEGDLRTSGSIDVAGLINGNLFVSEMTVGETGSIRGSIEAMNIEINGHVEGKISADTIIIGKNAVIKGDIFFKNTLRTEEGADIDGYIKRVNNGKANTEEDIAIEEIVERVESRKKPEIMPVTQHKEAV